MKASGFQSLKNNLRNYRETNKGVLWRHRQSGRFWGSFLIHWHSQKHEYWVFRCLVKSIWPLLCPDVSLWYLGAPRSPWNFLKPWKTIKKHDINENHNVFSVFLLFLGPIGPVFGPYRTRFLENAIWHVTWNAIWKAIRQGADAPHRTHKEKSRAKFWSKPGPTVLALNQYWGDVHEMFVKNHQNTIKKTINNTFIIK